MPTQIAALEIVICICYYAIHVFGKRALIEIGKIGIMCTYFSLRPFTQIKAGQLIKIAATSLGVGASVISLVYVGMAVIPMDKLTTDETNVSGHTYNDVVMYLATTARRSSAVAAIGGFVLGVCCLKVWTGFNTLVSKRDTVDQP